MVVENEPVDERFPSLEMKSPYRLSPVSSSAALAFPLKLENRLVLWKVKVTMPRLLIDPTRMPEEPSPSVKVPENLDFCWLVMWNSIISVCPESKKRFPSKWPVMLGTVTEQSRRDSRGSTKQLPAVVD